jgi:hypothetical protein
MTDKEIEELDEEVHTKVQVFCCEYHGHSALQDCLGPKAGQNKEWVTIAKLVETIKHERSLMRSAVAMLGKK